MLIFPMAGELFGSFFLTRSWLVLLTGAVMVLFSVVGGWNRLRIRQKEAEEAPDQAAANQKSYLVFCLGMVLFLISGLYWQLATGILPTFQFR